VLSKAGAKLAYNTRCYHVRGDYCSRRS